MIRIGRLGSGGIAIGLLVSTALSGATPLAALARTQTTYKIAVDNPNAVGVAGHNFEYVDYFPREGVKVHSTDVVDFNWNTGAVDGAHTVSFLPQGAASPDFVVPEADDPGGFQLELNPEVLAPSDPSCGTKTNPCVYDGTKKLNSGFNTNAAGADFFVKLDASLLKGGNSTVVNYLCEIHPGMAGSVTLVSDKRDASELEDVRDRASDQFERDTDAALRADRRDNKASVKLNPDGSTHTVTAIAGTATQYVEVAEMLPSPLTIKKGDSVDFVTKTIKDPHTVTFPNGSGSLGVDPLKPVCEGPIDTPVADLNPFLCANPGLFEVHFFPQPQGATSIVSPTTVGTSGIIATNPGAVNHFTFSFPNAGTFEYQCRIHDHMTGTIVVGS